MADIRQNVMPTTTSSCSGTCDTAKSCPLSRIRATETLIPLRAGEQLPIGSDDAARFDGNR